MSRRTADLVSAAIVALWMCLLATAFPPLIKVMNANDLLTPVSNMVGFGLACALAGVLLRCVFVVAGLLRGQDGPRLLAILIGGLSTLVGVSFLLYGLADELVTDGRGALALLLTVVGGPVLVVAGILGGELALPKSGFSRGSRADLLKLASLGRPPKG